MLSLAALSDMNVMIGTPCYMGMCSSIYVASMFRLVDAAAHANLRLKQELLSESMITRARTRILSRFIASDCTHLLWVDADIEFAPEDFARLLLADLDVVAGVYPLKRFDWPEVTPSGLTRAQFEDVYTPYPVNTLPGQNLVPDKDGFAEVAEATTGFLCIKRQVILDMIQAYPALECIPEDGNDGANHFYLFDSMIKDKRFLSEDYAFCQRWRDIGGKVFVDVASKLNHAGVNVWRGDFHAHLQTLNLSAEVLTHLFPKRRV